jgi:hypothetical protein
MIEQFFRSLKQECGWQHNFENFAEAGEKIREWIKWYNQERPHRLSSTQIRTYKRSSGPDTSLSLQMTENQLDGAEANPHFAFHALVNANGTLYDPSYGVTRSSIPYTETAFNTTPLQSSTAFPSQPNLPSGCNCGH